MNTSIQMKISLFIILCINFIIKIKSIDIVDNSDEIELYKHLFGRLNTIIQGNTLLNQDVKKLYNKIELLERKLANNQKLQISEELKNIDTIETDIIYCNSTKAADISNNTDVYCFGDNWVVIQRRTDGSENFYRDWNDYKYGFGNKSNEFFIGLEKLYGLTSSKSHELLIVMQDFEKESRYAKYDHFEIGSEQEQYSLKSLGAYSGNAGDSLTYHKGSKFSTKGHDNDQHSDFNCAEKFTGAWWYKACHESNLNGCYTDANLWNPKKSIACGIQWESFRGQWYSLKFVQIMIRPKIE